jgi:hypothetical protein
VVDINASIIITGSPVVDNYGDMEITSHSLGYRTTLAFNHVNGGATMPTKSKEM